MIQRQVGSRITSPTDGLDQKIRRFLDDLKNFKIANPDAQKQMEQMQAGVEQIRQTTPRPRRARAHPRHARTSKGTPSQDAATAAHAAEPGDGKPRAETKPNQAESSSKGGRQQG